MSLAYAMLGFDVAALVVSAEAAVTGASAGFASGAGLCAGILLPQYAVAAQVYG